MGEERPEKRQRLTHDDWESKVLGSGDYTKVLPHNEVPFVNRHGELFDLFYVNAAVILKLLDCRREEVGIRDWRPCSVAVAAQMFGSGKTTLGDNFIKQLKEQETNNFIQEKLTGDDWRDELTRAQSAASWYYNLNGCKNMYDVAKVLDYEKFENRSSTEALDIARYIFAKARELGEPVFVHFDEIGDLQLNVKQLREAVRRVWELMLQHQGDMPRIYFYLSGKSVPLSAIGGSSSPVGTKWIILNLLEEKHIRRIVETATSATSSSLCRHVAKIQGLPAALQRWTGGSPRLLVYSLRVLHHLLRGGRAFDDAEKAMEEVYGILKDQQAVASEVFLAKKDEAAWQQTWLYLILLAQLRVPCQRETILLVGSAEHSLDLLLGRLNVYISKPEQPIEGMPDAFYISHMKMIDKFVRKRYASDCRVQLFLGDEGTSAKAEDLLEHMVAQRIVVQACLHPQESHLNWGDLMKPLLQGTKAEQLEAKLDQGCPLSSFPKVTASAQRLSKSASSLPQQLCREDLAAAMQTLHSGRLYRPAPKSSSADLFIKQPTLTIEVQDKSGVSTGVSFADVCQEVKKCIQEGPVLWVLVALKLNELLSRCVGEARPLVLESGTYQQEELADGGSGGLLYRPESRKSWQKRIQNGEWHDVTTKIQPKGKGQTLQVRQELQLVIPHPKHVKEFLGESDFEIVKELAKNPSDRMVDIPFLSRFYNFQQPPAQGPSAGSAGATSTSAVVWVRELIRKEDGIVTAKLRPKEEGFQGEDEPEQAFKVQSREGAQLNDVDDLKTAIKQRKQNTLKDVDADQIGIYLQEAGEWQRITGASTSLRQNTSEQDCYGFLPRRAT